MINVPSLKHGLLIIVIILFSFPSLALGTPEEPAITFEHLYQYGKNEYTAGNWGDCVAFLLRALEDYNYFRGETMWCRAKCGTKFPRGGNNAAAQKTDDDALDADDRWTSAFMYAEAQRALCLLKCNQERLTAERPPLGSYEIYEEMKARRPYHYLQFCYWKLNDLRRAVRAAYTYLVANELDADTLENLRFYMEQPRFQREMLVDHLQQQYERDYMNGVLAHDAGDWQRCIDKLEKSSRQLLETVGECRLACEDHLDWSSLRGANPELSVVYTSLYASFIRCRRSCLAELQRVNGRAVPHLLASHFEFLHVCQFKTNRGRNACQSVETALILEAGKINPMTRYSKHVYLTLYEMPELFQPLPEVLELARKMEVERRYLTFIDENFRYDKNDELLPAHAEDARPFDATIDFTDSFDYSPLITTTIVDVAECRTLERVARLPYALRPHGNAAAAYRALAEEVAQRVANIYDSRVAFRRVHCADDKPHTAFECDRAAFLIGISDRATRKAKTDDDVIRSTCGTVVDGPFFGCALLYCIE